MTSTSPEWSCSTGAVISEAMAAGADPKAVTIKHSKSRNAVRRSGVVSDIVPFQHHGVEMRTLSCEGGKEVTARFARFAARSTGRQNRRQPRPLGVPASWRFCVDAPGYDWHIQAKANRQIRPLNSCKPRRGKGLRSAAIGN